MRACGSRVPGSAYLTLPTTSKVGKPVEDFLICPPRKIDVGSLGISPVGMSLFLSKKSSIAHLVDWVGSESYPNVADYIEEVRRLGLSRKISSRFEFRLLSSESRILQIHPRAWIENAYEYYLEEGSLFGISGPEVMGITMCPRKRPQHEPEQSLDMCSRLYWQDVAGGRISEGLDETYRDIERDLPSGTYPAYRRPDGVVPKYTPAIFASFPISHIEIIRNDGEEIKVADRAKRSGIPISFMEF